MVTVSAEAAPSIEIVADLILSLICHLCLLLHLGANWKGTMFSFVLQGIAPAAVRNVVLSAGWGQGQGHSS